MKKNQIPTPIEKLQALASLAPKDEQTPKQSSKIDKKSQRRGAQGLDLGPFNMGKYLTYYGYPFNEKERGSRMLYRFEHCPFDPSHGRNDSYVFQEADGTLGFHCSHNSCKAAGYMWEDARKKISGEDKLTQFFENYDPDYYKNKEKKQTPLQAAGSTGSLATGMLDKYEITCDLDFSDTNSDIPVPHKIDPGEFFKKNKKGRVAFIPKLMAKYYAIYLKNIAHTADVFWRYEKGVWQRFSEYQLYSICVQALDDAVQPNYLDGTIKILRGLVNKEPEDWPDTQWDGRVNCLTGMLNTKTGKQEPHDPELGSRSQVPCNYDWKAECPKWLEFLEQIFPDGEDKIDLLQQFFGYCLMADCRYEKALFLKGDGGNGKGTVLHALRTMIGVKNCASLTMRDIADPKFTLYFLQGKMINIATELSHKDAMATEMFKTIVSGEPLTSERKYGDKFEFSPYVKVIIAMNDIPVIPDRSAGLKRRLIVLNFDQSFEGKEDPDLKSKLSKEKDGIFMWAILGLEKLLKNNRFQMGETVIKETKKFINDMNPVVEFFEETFDETPQGAVGVTWAYETYREWCKNRGNRPLSSRKFAIEVERFFLSVKREPHTGSRRIHFIGIKQKIDVDIH